MYSRAGSLIGLGGEKTPSVADIIGSSLVERCHNPKALVCVGWLESGMRWFCPIEDVPPRDVGQFGGKATSLARMFQHKLPVPDAIVIPVEVMSHFLSHNRLEKRAVAALETGSKRRLNSLQKAILKAPLPEELEAVLAVQARRLGLGIGDEGVAVRSSAIGEDGISHSFAGQYASVLHILDEPSLFRAIKTCWASWFSESALTVRRKSPGTLKTCGMAVLIQQQIHARCAGVLFTINPLTGSWREMVLEACWGQGEALVSGKVRPDRVVLRRPRKTPKPVQRVLARVQVETLELELGHQARALVPDANGGLEWCDVKNPGEPVLGEEDARRIGRVGLRAEALAKCPQDIEWALDQRGVLVVLQARPITASPPKRGGKVLWTRRFFGERWTGLASPMGWSIVQEALHEFIAYPRTSSLYLGGEASTQLVQGRPYFNVTIFRHLLFKFPGGPPPRFLLEFLPPDEERRWLRRRAAPPSVSVYASIFRETFQEKRWRRFRWNPWTNPRAWEKFEAELQEALPGLMDEQGDSEQQFVESQKWLREYIKIHICSLLFANIFYQLCEGALPPELRRDLLRCPAENKTQLVNRDLYDLSKGSDKDLFLAKHGHRASTASWEIFSTRWAEDPKTLDRLIKPYEAGVLSDPNRLGREQEALSESAMKKLRALSRGPGGLGLVRMVGLTRRYLQLREDQRYVFDALLFAMKKILQRRGRALLGKEGECWVEYLRKDELLSVSAGSLTPTKALEIASARRKQWVQFAAAPNPPVFLSGEEEFDLAERTQRLNGLGISTGSHSGRARIVSSPEEAANFKPGDILVATATDPGWTPLFLVAGAVVLELGSMLSHGAVLAREYGIPAVVNVPDLFSHVVDGQIITVDGTRGVVWLDPRE
jgi:phosphohistidine swiveling domain-containing protein